MRAPVANEITHEGNMGKEAYDMSIDVTSLPKIMSQLTDMYTDKVLATLREPASNAHDSHKRVGQTRPIEITLPTLLDTNYTVTDYGEGLDNVDMRDVVSKYGASTKLDNDDESGYLGLGFKAPLTYTSQFTLVGYKNGKQYTFLIMRGAGTGVGRVSLEDVRPTKRPNGVTVSIPVVDGGIEAFREKANWFFRFWNPEDVLIDGKHPEPWEGVQIDPDITLVSRYGFPWQNDVVVMGNVPYKIPWHLSVIGNAYADHRAVVRIPMGSITFPPPREEIEDSRFTRETLDTIRNFILETLGRQVRDEYDRAHTPAEAFVVQEKYKELKPPGWDEWRGETIPNRHEFAVPDDERAWRYYTGSDSAVKYEYDSKYDVSATITLNIKDTRRVGIFVYGYPNKTFTRVHKDKIEKFLINKGYELPKHRREVYILPPSIERLPIWFDVCPRYHWDDIATVKVERRKRTDADQTPTFTFLWENNDGRKVSDKLDEGKRIAYVSPVHHDQFFWLKKAFLGRRDAWQIVVLHPRSWDKFRRENPRAVSVRVAAAYEYRRLMRSMTPEQRRLVGSRMDDTLDTLSNVPADDVHDLRLSRWLKEVESVFQGHFAKRMEAFSAMAHREIMRMQPSGNFLRALYSAPSYATTGTAPEWINESYPLLRCLGYPARREHIVEYINAIYTTRQQEKKA